MQFISYLKSVSHSGQLQRSNQFGRQHRCPVTGHPDIAPVPRQCNGVPGQIFDHGATLAGHFPDKGSAKHQRAFVHF